MTAINNPVNLLCASEQCRRTQSHDGGWMVRRKRDNVYHAACWNAVRAAGSTVEVLGGFVNGVYERVQDA